MQRCPAAAGGPRGAIGGKGDPRGDRGQHHGGPGILSGFGFPADRRAIAAPITGEILSRLDFLAKVGLGYLTLDRPAETLSGGELQRVRLASGLGSGLVGVCYVLDEPSIGLHPRDNQRLIEALQGLQGRGNTVLVVEHDEAIMRRADWLVDLVPGRGGTAGGSWPKARPPRLRPTRPRSPAATWPARRRSPCPPARRRVAMTRAITSKA